MYLSGGYEFGAYLLGVSLETYGAIHRIVGVMAVTQATIHVVIMAGSLFLSLAILPLITKRVYEVFLRTHQVFALAALYAIWEHTRTLANKHIRQYLYICILFQNTVIGRKSTKITVDSRGENVVCVTISPPRPWQVRAGQRIQLNIPGIGIFYLFQMHPFTITSISLLIRKRSGFTKKLAESNRSEYRAWFDGPYGPTAVGSGRTSERMGDYGHIFMVATGIGIATQIPYIKELLEGHRRASIRTRRVSIIWQLDEEGDWEGAHDWLQELVKEDETYVRDIFPQMNSLD
ncbi:hypothetical protein BJX76DRAFT_350474 [Aspergillus varians]